MSISKRQMFSEVYDEQEEVLSLIDKPIRVKDLDISFMGKLSKFDFHIVGEKNNKSYKCLCPLCRNWVDEWQNWHDYKNDLEAELFAKCECGSVIPQGDLICEEIK